MPRITRAAPRSERDNTTRYLCAATQLSSAFTDEAIREYLVEPTRSLPPSPGVDDVVVLGEAIAARMRRKYRDGVLAVLALLFVLAAPTPLLLGWVVLALVVGLAGILRRPGKVDAPTASRPSFHVLPIALLVVLLISYVGGFDDLADVLGLAPSTFDSEGSDWFFVSIVLIVWMLAVLLADQLIVWRHLTRRFHRDAINAIANPLHSGRPILQAGPPRFVDQLRRYAATRHSGHVDGSARLVVHRGYSPFVGAGFEYRPWSIAVPLRRTGTPSGSTTVELTTDTFYRSIREELAGLGRATPLTPGQRLGRLTIDDQIIVPAEELVKHLHDQTSTEILPSPDNPPPSTVPATTVAALRAEPREWARYYLRVQVETWDRDLVLTVFVHAAMDDATLYVEWTPCVLLPIKKQLREIDQLRPMSLEPVRRAIAGLVTLPATIFGRAVHTLKPIRQLPPEHGLFNADMYGSLRSLREMAADDDPHNYFQLADIDRYLKILNSRFVLAVSQLLGNAGYSAASFTEQAATVVNNSVSINGDISGNIVQAKTIGRDVTFGG